MGSRNFEGKRLMSERETCEYVGLGRSKCRSWAEEIGAIRRIGRRVLYDRAVIDRAVDELAEHTACNQA